MSFYNIRAVERNWDEVAFMLHKKTKTKINYFGERSAEDELRSLTVQLVYIQQARQVWSFHSRSCQGKCHSEITDIRKKKSPLSFFEKCSKKTTLELYVTLFIWDGRFPPNAIKHVVSTAAIFCEHRDSRFTSYSLLEFLPAVGHKECSAAIEQDSRLL